MSAKVQKFRRLKHGDPQKLKVLAEDLDMRDTNAGAVRGPARNRWRRSLASGLAVVLALTGAAGAGYMIDEVPFDRIVKRVPSTACLIKGNVADTGERIYHMPWQRYYLATTISQIRGERWFCSETEARQAGWRRSKV